MNDSSFPEKKKRPFRLGVGGPVGSGKTMCVLRLSQWLKDEVLNNPPPALMVLESEPHDLRSGMYTGCYSGRLFVRSVLSGPADAVSQNGRTKSVRFERYSQSVYLKPSSGCDVCRNGGVIMSQLTKLCRLVGVNASVLLAVLLMATGCAGYDPRGIAVGTPLADVRKMMGEPTAEHARPRADPLAQRRLEFARGKHTYMLDFDARDRLLSWSQVLDEVNFSKVIPGWREDSVYALLGTPANIRRVGWRGEVVWSYRYESPFCVWFEISLIDASVVSTGNGPDPQCEGKVDSLNRE